MVLQVRSLRRRERVHPRQTRLRDGTRRNLHEPGRLLGVRLQIRLRLRRRSRRVCFQLRCRRNAVGMGGRASRRGNQGELNRDDRSNDRESVWQSSRVRSRDSSRRDRYEFLAVVRSTTNVSRVTFQLVIVELSSGAI